MASRVNNKILIPLVAGSVLMLGAVAGLMYTTMNRSAADHAAEAAEFASQNDWRRASRSFANAVNKEPTNVGYIEKWIDALEKTTPKTRLLYREDFQEQYLPALQALATAKRTDVAAHEAFLLMLLDQYRDAGGAALVEWEGLRDRGREALRNFPPGDEKAARLRRYSGIAGAGIMAQRLSISDENITRTKEDLEAALAATPGDEEVASALGEWYFANAATARQNREDEKADAFIGQGRKFLEDFIKTHGPAPDAMYTLVAMEIREATRRDGGRSAPEQLAAAQMPRVTALLESLMTADPSRTMLRTARAVVLLSRALNVPDSAATSLRAMDRIIEARPLDARPRIFKANLLLEDGKFDEAIAELDKVVQMPDQPLSLLGMILHSERATALALKATASLTALEREQTAEARTARLESARKFRAAFREVTDGNPAELLFIDARIALAEERLDDARQLLTRYNEQTSDRDPRGLATLAQLLQRQNLPGEAIRAYEKLHTMGAATWQVYGILADLELNNRNTSAALRWVQQGLRVAPGNPVLLERERVLANLDAGPAGTDPVIRELLELEAKANEGNADVAAIRARLRELGSNAALTAGTRMAISNMMLQLGDREAAKPVLEQLAKELPNDQSIAQRLRLVEASDPVAEQLKMIDESNLPEIEKRIAKFRLLVQLNRTEEAVKELDAAEKIDPNNRVVLSARLDEALAKRDFAAAEAVAEKGKASNADGAQGLIFRTTLELRRGNAVEAEQFARQLTEKDRLNPAGHRLLGEARLARGQTQAGLASLQRALEITPNDLPTIVLLLNARIAAGQDAEALALARSKRAIAQGEPAFREPWLNLEFNAGDQNLAMDVRRRIFRSTPGDAVNSITLTQNLLRLGKIPEAEEVFRGLSAAVGEERTGFMPVVMLAVTNKEDQALAKFNQLLEQIPAERRKGEQHVSLSRALVEVGMASTALKALETGRALQEKESMIVDREIGDVLWGMQRYEEAAAAYASARSAPGSVDRDNLLLLRQAESLIRANRAGEAEALLNGARLDGTARTRGTLLLADAAASAKDLAKARQLLDQAVTNDQNSALALMRRGQLNLSDDVKFTRDAIADFEAALRLEPGLFAARQALAAAYIRNGEAERAVATIREALQRDPSNAEIRLTLVRVLQNTGRGDGALEVILEATRTLNDPAWSAMAADLYASREDWAGAVTQLERVWTTTKNATIARALVNALCGQRPPNLTRAREVLSESGLNVDGEAPLLMSRARISALDKKMPDAEKDVRAALAMISTQAMPEVSGFFREMARVFPTPEAQLRFLAASKPSAGFSEQVSMAMARLQTETRDEAAAGWTAIEKLGETAQNTGVRALALKMLGSRAYSARDYAAAAQFWERGLKDEPNDADMLNNLGYTLSKFLSRHEDGLKHVERAVEIAPQNPGYWDSLGAVLLALNKLDRAERALRQALNISTDAMSRTIAQIHLAELHLRNGNRRDADDLFQTAERMIGSDPQVAAAYGEEFERLRRLMRGGN
ncbi:MAG: tetratricopeptide repeat protein [Phycisphaerales bacterium]